MISRTAKTKIEAYEIINQRIEKGGKYHIELALEMIADFDLYSEYEINLTAHFWKDRLKLKTTIKKDNFSELEGLYLIGETDFNIETQKIKYYIKVGRGININNRLSQYPTYTPTTKYIDTMITSQSVSKEKCCHHWLSILGEQCGQTEWYEVKAELFMEIYKKGFTFFEKVLDK